MNTNKLKSILANQGKTQKELAKLFNCAYMTLNKKVNGEIKFSVNEIAELKKYLNLTDNEVVEIFINN